MLAVAFDTLKLARKLESAGMQPKTAQDTSAALSETFTEWLSIGNIATREDVQRLEAKIDNLEARVGAKFAETKADTLKWIIGAIGAQTIVQVAVLYGLIHH
jgi:hypothetical protein